ncbi:apelin receptor-like [Gigantopelta aegis]|uniref:apelin receptor-like n=1 Tax=Gigantopelta aegis TaxID=1735272 RepID=UPI001B88E491|nr:apelin receptor-like [Gigantopelta aegis]
MGSTANSLPNDTEWTVSKNFSTTVAFRIADGIDLYVPLLLSISGIVCNILVVMVMHSKYFRHNSTSFYMMVNAIVDTSSLALVLPAHWLYVNFPGLFVKTPQSHVMCKFFNFFGWGTSDLGILLTVAMTTERAIAVTLPLRVNSLCTKRRAKIGVAVVTVIVTVKDLHFLMTSVMVSRGEAEYLCEVSTENPFYSLFWTTLWPWIHNAFLLASFVIISVSNVIIIKHVNRSNRTKFVKNLCGQKIHGNTARLQSRGRQLSVMLVMDSFTIVVFTLPYSVIVTVMSSGHGTDDSDVDKLMYAVAFYLLYVNRCANFYLYCLSGSRFRDVLKQILCCCCCCCCCRRSVFGGRGSGSLWASYSHTSPPLSPSGLPTSMSKISVAVCMNPSGPD